MERQRPICEMCGEDIITHVTFDIWGLATVYDPKTWEPAKTGEDASSVFGNDYIVVGECCAERLKKEWSRFLKRILVEF